MYQRLGGCSIRQRETKDRVAPSLNCPSKLKLKSDLFYYA